MAEKVTTAWSAFVALPAVAGILAQSSPIIARATDNYLAAVTAVQADPRFTMAVEKGGEVMHTVQEDARYKAYVGPYVERVAAVPQVQQAVSLLQQAAAVAFPAAAAPVAPAPAPVEATVEATVEAK